MDKLITAAEAASYIKDGMIIMVGGFHGCGSPHQILDALVASPVKDLTLICNDSGLHDGPGGRDYYGVAALLHAGKLKKIYCTHVGMNPEISRMVNSGKVELVLVPQGSMAEMIRAGGAGLGGVLTRTGLGTEVEDQEYVAGKTTIDGVEYLIKRPLRADVALIAGYKADKFGNIWYKGTMRNTNVVMATAADKVIAEVVEVVEIGEIPPEDIVTSGVLVDHLVKGGISK